MERSCLTRMPPSTLFTGVGQPVREELEEIGVGSDRISYIANGVNTSHFHPSADRKEIREKFGIPEDDLVLLSVGRMTPAKQPFTLIEVFAHLEKRLGDTTLCIAGGGELLEAAQGLARRMGLRNIRFLGSVDHDRDLPGLYACADYYIMASKYEGGMPPLTLAEAMASGLPCIVSDIPNLRIVNEADAGITIDFDGVSEASDIIFEYLKGDHSSQARNARRYAEDMLSWDILSTEYLHLFEHLTNG